MKKILFLMMLVSGICYAGRIPIELEYAKTEQQQTLGLMQRKELGANQGMLFTYKEAEVHRIWMFNCFIDLSVAFLNDHLRILEIHELKAYPEMMDPKRPVLTLKDISLYPPYDPITRFFMQQSVQSSAKTSYVLEMNAKWFYNHRVTVGDQLIFNENSSQAYILQKE